MLPVRQGAHARNEKPMPVDNAIKERFCYNKNYNVSVKRGDNMKAEILCVLGTEIVVRTGAPIRTAVFYPYN